MASKPKKLSRQRHEVDYVAEANIYLSGVGFENNGAAMCHATYNGLTAVLTPFPVMHGEGVAFGLMLQLVMEYTEAGKWDDAEWKMVVDFYHSVGLPTKFSQIKIDDPNDALLAKIAQAIDETPNAHKMPFEVNADKILAGLKKVREMDI